jgi:S-adenosylmethionine:tRNA ribosyltransferase-isomerase
VSAKAPSDTHPRLGVCDRRGDADGGRAHELDAYDFTVPAELVAQEPAPERDLARLLVLDRVRNATLAHSRVRDLPRWLRPGDLLVVNETRVLRALLRGKKATGGAAAVLLLGPAHEPGCFRALLRCRGRQRVGQRFAFGPPGEEIPAELVALGLEGEVVLEFPRGISPFAIGEAPLPPYIRRHAPRVADLERYQSVFARVPGSVAAPTASLHLSQQLLRELAAAGVERAEVVLHVGAGTFRPLRPTDLAAGRLDAERFELPEATAQAVAKARARRGRIVAVGTTTTRVLESCATADRQVSAGAGETHLFLRPGHNFAVVDALLTNFHLPRSSPLLLASAFAGRESVLSAYAAAITGGYRFFSYGDAMLIL